jgi:hypothetical protein
MLHQKPRTRPRHSPHGCDMKLTDEQRQRIIKAMDETDIGKCDYLNMLAAGMRELAATYRSQRGNAVKAWNLEKIADDLEAK